jgi:hypothetical protein
MGYTPVVNGWHYNPNGWNYTGAGFDSSYMQIGVSHTTFGNYYLDDYSLVTDTFNASTLSTVYLSYGEVGGYAPPGDFNNIDVSNDSGITWHTVFRHSTNSHGHNLNASRIIVDITQFAAGQSMVKIRFHVGAYVFQTGTGLVIDSVVVSDNEPCTIPPDSAGVTATSRSYYCTGTQVSLRNDGLGGGVGQTYQWQYENASSGNAWANIPSAVYDTASYMQNGTTYYQCLITCGGLTAHTLPLQITDTPNDTAKVRSDSDVGICAAKNDTLHIVADTTAPGIIYQWEWASAPLGPYNIIPSATGTHYVATAANYSVDTYFKCLEICQSNGNSKASDYWIDYINSNPYCYCEPYNFNDCPPDTFGYGGTIRDVAIIGTALSNPTSGCSNGAMGAYNSYSYFPPSGTTTALLTRNTQYTISVTNDSIEPLIFVMWLDYNGNGVFDTSEYTLIYYRTL